MRFGIIGAGISGLSAALALAKRGHQVEIFQREADIGGLIATFDFDGTRIEHFYHFLCAGDVGYFQLCEELGLADRVKIKRPKTGFYYQGHSYPFTSALDLLRFTPLPFLQRIRFGLFALEAQFKNEWAQLDQLTGKPWLIDRLGYRAYDVIWHPLLSLKFGRYHETISAAWVWHRVHRVAQSRRQMGYLEGGTSLLIDTLVERLQQLGVAIHPGRPVTQILADADRVSGLRSEGHEDFHCDRVISTVPLKVTAKLLPPGWDDFKKRLEQIDYIGVVCVSFKLDRPISKYFWLNCNDTRIPFNGIIEYTNLNPLGPDDGHIAYVPHYVPTDTDTYSIRDDEIVERTWEGMKLISPELRDENRLAHHVARTPFAQAITPTGFLNVLPDQEAPLQGLSLLDSTYLYPADRTQSGHILKANELVARIG